MKSNLSAVRFLNENEIFSISIDPDFTAPAIEFVYDKLGIDGACFHIYEDGFYLGDESEESAIEIAKNSGFEGWEELRIEMDSLYTAKMEDLAYDAIRENFFSPFEVRKDGEIIIYAFEDDEQYTDDKIKEMYLENDTKIEDHFTTYPRLKAFKVVI